MKMTSRVLLPMYTDHQSVTAETLDCRKIFHHERLTECTAVYYSTMTRHQNRKYPDTSKYD